MVGLCAPSYQVGFKDVYPWLWSVMFGIALSLGERRGAFQAWVVGDPEDPCNRLDRGEYYAKCLIALVVTIALPVIGFAWAMLYVGKTLDELNAFDGIMGFWWIMISLWLAAMPLGALHVWMVIAYKHNDGRWRPLRLEYERPSEAWAAGTVPYTDWAWAIAAFVAPFMATMLFGALQSEVIRGILVGLLFISAMYMIWRR